MELGCVKISINVCCVLCCAVCCVCVECGSVCCVLSVVVVLTCAFNKGVCPSMPTGAPNYGHILVDMALKNPHVQAAWTCSHAGSQTPVCSWHCASEASYHRERKRNPCPQSRIRNQRAFPQLSGHIRQ